MLNALPGREPMEAAGRHSPEGSRVPRVLVCECREVTDVPLHRLVQSKSWVTVAVNDANTFLSMLSQHGADALVVGLSIESGEQIGMLRLARRILPGVPLLVLASSISEITEAQIRGLGVTWYGVAPAKTEELKQAVRSAVIDRPGGTCAHTAPRMERKPE